MSSSTQPRISRPFLWLSVVVAALLAFELPTTWIAYSDRQVHQSPFLNFHPLFAFLYVPLAFGLFWPILIEIAAWATRRPGQPPVWPAKTALIVFILAACCSAPFAVLEYRRQIRGLEAVRAEKLRMDTFRAQPEVEKQKALTGLRANGVASLSEPLTGPQIEAVNHYLDTHSHNPLELENAARHYGTSVAVMEHLASRSYCPGPVLEIVFNNVLELQKDPPPQLLLNPYEVLYNLAWNPNIPVSVLVRMLDNPDPQVRAAAAASLATRKKNQH